MFGRNGKYEIKNKIKKKNQCSPRNVDGCKWSTHDLINGCVPLGSSVDGGIRLQVRSGWYYCSQCFSLFSVVKKKKSYDNKTNICVFCALAHVHYCGIG